MSRVSQRGFYDGNAPTKGRTDEKTDQPAFKDAHDQCAACFDERHYPLHYGRKQPRIQTALLGHSLVHSLVGSHPLLVHLLCPTRFARALYSLTSLTPSLVAQWMIGWLFILCFFLFWTTVHLIRQKDAPLLAFFLCCSTARPRFIRNRGRCFMFTARLHSYGNHWCTEVLSFVA